MTSDISSLVEDFKTAVEAENIQQAGDIYEEILDVLDLERTDELKLALRSRVATIEDDEEEVVDAYLGSYLESRTIRYRFKVLAGTLVERYDELQKENEFDEYWNELEETIEELRDVEPAFEETKAETDPIVDGVEVQADVEILYAEFDNKIEKPLEKGEKFTIELRIANIGDEAAEELSLSIESLDTIVGTDSTDKIGRLDGGDEFVDSYDFEVIDQGDGRITFEVTSENGGSDQTSVSVPLEGDTTSIVDYADDNGVIQTNGLRLAIDDWRGGEIDTDLLREVIDHWRSGDQVE